MPDLGLELVWVAPGSFQMGAADVAPPVHAVQISRGYWIGKYEVTQAEYEATLGKSPSASKGVRNPVDTVSWDDAVAFCAKLTEREQNAGRLPEGYEYRLPTEAEWEYAARGGTGSRGYTYPGSNKLDEVAWYKDNSGGKAHPVGLKKPNELGLYDMAGNVMEWCLDSCEYKNGVITDAYQTGVSDPVCRKGSDRANRGPGWDFPAGCHRPGNRYGAAPDRCSAALGFRACLGPVVQVR